MEASANPSELTTPSCPPAPEPEEQTSRTVRDDRVTGSYHKVTVHGRHKVTVHGRTWPVAA